MSGQYTAPSKRCPQCGRVRPLSEFYVRHRPGAQPVSPYCKPCTIVRVREWRQNNRDKYRISRRKMKYGLTPEAFADMLRRQGGGCAVCGATVSGNESCLDLLVDHCHETGKVRGLLCHGCNAGIGHFRDNPDRLTAAAYYLRRFRKSKRSG